MGTSLGDFGRRPRHAGAARPSERPSRLTSHRADPERLACLKRLAALLRRNRKEGSK